jgi:hypothetical protein
MALRPPSGESQPHHPPSLGTSLLHEHLKFGYLERAIDRYFFPFREVFKQTFYIPLASPFLSVHLHVDDGLPFGKNLFVGPESTLRTSIFLLGY